MEHPSQPLLDRRRFLQLSGAGAAAAVAGPVLGWTTMLGEMRVGVLLPSGEGRQAMADELLAGLRAGLEGSGLRARPRLRSGRVPDGHGRARSVMRAVLEERPDVVVAAVTEPVAAALEPLSAEARVPLVAANVGAHAFHPAGGTTASLHAWQASYALGGWAVRNLGPRAAVAVTLREAGYDTVYAFRRGVEAAGGTMVATRVTHEQAADAGLGTLVRTMRAVRPDHVHVLATGHAAVDVFRALGDLDARVPLSAGGLSVDERVLPALGRSALGVTSVAAWRGTAGSPGGPYETLGSEAARLAIAAFRGETASAGGGLLLRRVDSGPAGPRNVTIGTIPADQDPADALAGLDVNRCAYIDEYPCP